jgi:hypothetical protein
MAFAIAAGSVGVAGATGALGHTEFDLTDVDLKDLREIRAVAAARIAERREELAVLEAEFAVLEEALEEAECSSSTAVAYEGRPMAKAGRRLTPGFRHSVTG